jgi:predicted HTH transcriptional regulator
MPETNRIEYKAKLTKHLDLVEQLGSGIPRILETYGKACFKFSNNFLRMTFPKAASDVDDKGANDGSAIGGAIGSAIGGAKETLTDSQQRVLKFILDKPNVAYREVADKLGINPSAAQKHFDALKNKGVITRKGGTRGIWEVDKKYKRQ